MDILKVHIPKKNKVEKSISKIEKKSKIQWYLNQEVIMKFKENKTKLKFGWNLQRALIKLKFVQW